MTARSSALLCFDQEKRQHTIGDSVGDQIWFLQPVCLTFNWSVLRTRPEERCDGEHRRTQ
jgi:hypothetical protein